MAYTIELEKEVSDPIIKKVAERCAKGAFYKAERELTDLLELCAKINKLVGYPEEFFNIEGQFVIKFYNDGALLFRVDSTCASWKPANLRPVFRHTMEYSELNKYMEGVVIGLEFTK